MPQSSEVDRITKLFQRMGMHEHAMPSHTSPEFTAFSHLTTLIDDIEQAEQKAIGGILQQICENLLQLKNKEDRQRYLVVIQGIINKTPNLTPAQKSFFSQQVNLLSEHLHRIP